MIQVEISQKFGGIKNSINLFYLILKVNHIYEPTVLHYTSIYIYIHIYIYIYISWLVNAMVSHITLSGPHYF